MGDGGGGLVRCARRWGTTRGVLRVRSGCKLHEGILVEKLIVCVMILCISSERRHLVADAGITYLRCAYACV